MRRNTLWYSIGRNVALFEIMSFEEWLLLYICCSRNHHNCVYVVLWQVILEVIKLVFCLPSSTVYILIRIRIQIKIKIRIWIQFPMQIWIRIRIWILKKCRIRVWIKMIPHTANMYSSIPIVLFQETGNWSCCPQAKQLQTFWTRNKKRSSNKRETRDSV